MEKSSQTEPLLQHLGLLPHRDRLQPPVHMASELRAKFDILPRPQLETYWRARANAALYIES